MFKRMSDLELETSFKNKLFFVKKMISLVVWYILELNRIICVPPVTKKYEASKNPKTTIGGGNLINAGFLILMSKRGNSLRKELSPI